jgi:hypothetical protein
MTAPKVILVHLRRPVRSDPDESRADPFYEFGSFGCTRCHARNLMNPKRAHELAGARFAFAQGGQLGFRLVFRSAPVVAVNHADRCEVTWRPVRMPFCYDAAPLLIDVDGRSDFPSLKALLTDVDRTTWPACFSSRFRTRRVPMPRTTARELIRIYDKKYKAVPRSALARSYVDALPYPPNNPDLTRSARRARLQALRHAANNGAARAPCRSSPIRKC